MNLEEELDETKQKLESGGSKKSGPGISLLNQIKGPTEREAIN